MRAVSFDKEALNITIHNLYPDLALISPLYCSNGITCHVSFSRKIDNGDTMEARFGLVCRQRNFDGVLLYKLQRKYPNKVEDRPNNSTASTKDTATNMYLLVVWNISYDHHNRYVCLIECTDDFAWDEDKLWAFYKKYNNQFYLDYRSNIITWMIHGGTAMKTRCELTYGSDYKFDIIISKRTWSYSTKRPIKIDPKRLVLSLSMLMVLIYAVSLSIQPSFKLNIHNQCSNVDLVSPTYATSDELECYRAPDHNVCVGGMTRAGFIIYKPGSLSYIVLIYRLQRKQQHESTGISKDTSNISQLLVICKFSESQESYAGMLLVEHDKKLDWDEDKLKQLHQKYWHLLNVLVDPIRSDWLLNDKKTVLATTIKAMNGGYRWDIFISEEERNNAERPLWIDAER
jgi:hypothetical protein